MIHFLSRGNDFVRKYHWPNCVAPSATSLAVAFNETLHGRFSLEKVEDFGCRELSPMPSETTCSILPNVTDYPRCLREWGR